MSISVASLKFLMGIWCNYSWLGLEVGNKYNELQVSVDDGLGNTVPSTLSMVSFPHTPSVMFPVTCSQSQYSAAGRCGWY